MFQTYRERYGTTAGLDELDSLERSIRRRELRAHSLRRRREELAKLLADTEKQLGAVEAEMSGARATGALLIEDVIDRVKQENNEGWSPTPIRGFRVWRIEDNGVLGNQMRWSTETMVAKCLQNVPGQDVPHSVERCGPPPCGIYAVKELDRFAPALANGTVARSVVGVVAMTGKVVEHEIGFRAEKARTIAAMVNLDGTRALFDDHDRISTLFRDPEMAISATRQSIPSPEARQALEAIQRKETPWT